MPELSDSKRKAIEAWFHENFSLRGELGAAVSVWQDGVEVLSLADGWMSRERTRPWTADTLVPVWSSTKGPAVVACLMALEEAGLTLDARVVEAWPEFFLHRKDEITFAQLLSHQAGLCALDLKVPVFDYDAVIRALEHQRPLWPVGTQQAYHAKTFGFLLEEIVRRTTGAESLGQYFAEVFVEPWELDFWIGLPVSEHARVATLYPGKMNLGTGDQAFLKAFNSVGTVTNRAFASPAGLAAVQDFNRPETWAAGYPSMGGVGSARGLGRFYAKLAQGGALPPWIAAALQHRLTEGDDAVLCVPAAFSAGMMMDPVDGEAGEKLRQLFGPGKQAFGHPGAGGSLAFADPETGLAFAYVMNQMEVGVLPGEKALGLVAAL